MRVTRIFQVRRPHPSSIIRVQEKSERGVTDHMKKYVSLLLFALFAIPVYAQDSQLIPREILFSSPAKESPQLSPDGARLAFLAPNGKGVPNIWIKTLGKDDDTAVTEENHRGIQFYRWAEDGRHMLYEQDSDGDENDHVYSVDLNTKHIRDLTPFLGVKAMGLLTSLHSPIEILVGLNLRDPHVFDVYRVNLVSGAVVLDTRNPGDVLSWTVDPEFVIRGATAFDPKTGATIVRVRDSMKQPWRDIVTWPFEDSLMFGQVNGGSVIVDFSADGQSLYIVSASHSDTGRLVRVDARTGKKLDVLAADAQSDVVPDMDLLSDNYRPLVLSNPATHQIQAVAFDYLQWEWKIIDPAIREDFEILQKEYPGFLRVISRDNSDSKWIVAQTAADAPERFYLYDRKEKTAQFLFADNPEILKYQLAKTKPVVITARDGLNLVSYLTLPLHAESKPFPMVLFPHGGPWWRDDLGSNWSYDPVVQFLANRGYAVLQVNFRGSTGFGKKFLNAGNHQYGLGMQDDLTDGVKWAIREGVADPKRIAIMGFSGGGYATLRGLTKTPELYACGADIVGEADVKVDLLTMPSWWAPVKTRWIRRLGDVEHDDALNREISPLYEADRVRAPVLVANGGNDPRVNVEPTEKMVAALRERKVPVTFVVYPDEGHGFSRAENNMDLYGRIDDFLANCLGGRSEPWKPVAGSTAELK